MRKLIGICGLIGSGKDTVANHLIENHGFRKDSFAKPLKDAVSSIFGWDREMLEGITKESRLFRDTEDKYWSKVLDRPITPRNMLQYFGTEICRDSLHPTIWADSLIQRAKITYEDLVVPDVRFIDEAKSLNSMGGIIVYITRKDIIQPKSVHASEADISTIGRNYSRYGLSNNGTLKEFKNKIDKWYLTEIDGM